MQATPQAEIEFPGSRLKVTASVVNDQDKERLWAELIKQAPFFDGYRKGTTRTIPMVLLRPENRTH